MFKKYDPRGVRNYRSYKLADLCRLYRSKKLHAQTIRAWIKSGKLESINDGKNIFVYGAVFKQFLIDRNSSNKRRLKINQFLCLKCKTIFEPEGNTLTKLTYGVNKCIAALSNCVSCGHEVSRLFKAKLSQEIIATFNVKQNEVLELCNRECSSGNTHDKAVEKDASSESLESPFTRGREETATASHNAHHKPKKTRRSRGNTHGDEQLSLF